MLGLKPCAEAFAPTWARAGIAIRSAEIAMSEVIMAVDLVFMILEDYWRVIGMLLAILAIEALIDARGIRVQIVHLRVDGRHIALEGGIG